MKRSRKGLKRRYGRAKASGKFRSRAKLPWPKYNRQLTHELERLDVSDPAYVRQEFSDSVAAYYHEGMSAQALAEKLVRNFFGEEELTYRIGARE